MLSESEVQRHGRHCVLEHSMFDTQSAAVENIQAFQTALQFLKSRALPVSDLNIKGTFSRYTVEWVEQGVQTRD